MIYYSERNKTTTKPINIKDIPNMKEYINSILEYASKLNSELSLLLIDDLLDNNYEVIMNKELKKYLYEQDNNISFLKSPRLSYIMREEVGSNIKAHERVILNSRHPWYIRLRRKENYQTAVYSKK